MPLEIIRNDLTKVKADAIVNTAHPSLLGGGGVDGAVHKAAGPALLSECVSLGGCEVGQAKITKGYKLPAKYIIHTVGPVWQGGHGNEEKLLADCYLNSLELAKKYQLESIAFPLISSGTFGYPKDKALKTAISVIGGFLLENDMTVYLVVFDKKSFALSEKLFSSIKQFIDDNYVDENRNIRDMNERRLQAAIYTQESLISSMNVHTAENESRYSLEDVTKHLDETFSQMLLRMIDKKGMTDAETYKKANIDRKLFSKIRNDIYYKPSKQTAIAFAISLRLDMEETAELLKKAGFALSNSNLFDVIIRYFIEDRNYNVFEINDALFYFDQHLLGAL